MPPRAFDYRNAVRTEQDYTAIADVPMTLASDDIINSYLQDKTALIFGLCLMAVTVVLILEPRRLGVEQVERSAAGPQPAYPLAAGGPLLAAWWAPWPSKAPLCTAACWPMAGAESGPAGADSRIFSSPGPGAPSGGFFLLWHLALRWAGLAPGGTAVLAAAVPIRSLPLGLVVCGATLLVEYRWFTSYGVNDAGYPLAAVNLFHLLSPE